ncbi:hypothetical protein JTB14_026449 [Gonioctena quinquepunctata]|nr:hypothetical protein JTB14_026449 [Gonioctena quinquepunctata]
MLNKIGTSQPQPGPSYQNSNVYTTLPIQELSNSENDMNMEIGYETDKHAKKQAKKQAKNKRRRESKQKTTDKSINESTEAIQNKVTAKKVGERETNQR